MADTTISFILPVDGAITQYFGENGAVYSKWGYAGHNGVDFGVQNGTPVKAAADGKVDRISFEDGGYGRYVRLSHKGGYYLTWYAHLKSTLVPVGAIVSQGDVIALSDNTGFSTGPHLHWGLSIPTTPNPGYKTYHDPMKYVGNTSNPPPPGEIPDFSLDINGIQYEVIVDVLNIRSGPSTSYPIVGRLKRSDIVSPAICTTPTEIWVKLADGQWCAALYQGVTHMVRKA